MSTTDALKSGASTALWPALKDEAACLAAADAALQPLMDDVITSASGLFDALARHLSHKLQNRHLPEGLLMHLFRDYALARTEAEAEAIIEADLRIIQSHDPAARDWVVPFLFFKGFHALQCHRLAHYLWGVDRQHLALYLQNRISDLFGVDIHPAARIGRGVMMDHATGIVIGETAVVEDDVLMWHSVTLGGRSLEGGDRHPKIRKGAALGANSTIIGNIDIGENAKVAAGSVVIADVPANATAVGAPARIII
ncbi:MAG: serine O-acetyltransferase [Micavibrio sp.]|nr:serine O-acetyltransferase [Micavibrio sp.]